MADFGNSLEEMDLEAFMNTRSWLEKALTDAGAEVTDAGIGMGQADVGINLQGAPFSVSIKPRPMGTPLKIGTEITGDETERCAKIAEGHAESVESAISEGRLHRSVEANTYGKRSN